MNDRIIALAKQNGNLVTTSQMAEAGFSRTAVSKYAAEGKLVRVSHGIYALPDTVIDEMFVFSLRCKDIVFSHESSLFLNNLSDRTPFIATVTISSGRMLPLTMRNSCACFYAGSGLFELGLVTRKTTFGNPVRCYDPERTVCDILRSRSRMDEETVISAVKNYAVKKDKNLFRLYEYAQKFKVLETVRKYMEVLV